MFRIAIQFGFLLSAIYIAGCRSVPPAPDTPPTDDNSPAAIVEPDPIEAGIAPPTGAYAPGFDALHYDIVLQLPDTGSFVRGVTSAHIALRPPRRDTLALDFTGMLVEAVGWDAKPLPFEHRAGRLLVPVPSVLRSGDTLRVDITYSGRPDDGLILGRNIHGDVTAFADNWPNRARFWFPSIDHPSDKASVRFTVNAREGRQVIANGALHEDGDASTWVWINDEPIPTYTMVVGAADFAVTEVGTVCISGDDERTCTPVTTWIFPQDSAAAAPSFRRADAMVAFFNRLIAPFPYAKLAHVQSSTRFGGMENVSAIFYPEEALSAGVDIESTVAHETAHQWFGNSVTEADWNHLWLSEGFATYFGALFFEETDGEDRFRTMMDKTKHDYLSSGVVDLPMVNPNQSNLFALLNANNYDKGAWVLHMLRRQLGDGAFFDGIRAYYRGHEHNTALSDDLRRALEKASGLDLTVFFDQWVYSPGYPELSVKWSWNREASTVDLRIEQVQSAAWPAFEVPLVVAFSTPSGSERRRVDLEGRTTEVTFEMEAEPNDLIIDPDADLLHVVKAASR